MNFYIELKQNLNDIDYLKQNIDKFNDLSTSDIELLFNDDEVSFEFKQIITEFCYRRINNLPFNTFLKALFYIEDPQIFIKCYGRRIDNLSYTEISELIYSSHLDVACLEQITKLESFNRYLKWEKEKKIGTKLQSFMLGLKLELNSDNKEELSIIGDEIKELIKLYPEYFEDVEYLLNNYLCYISQDYYSMGLRDLIDTNIVPIMNYYLKNHKTLNNDTLKCYILFHLKELNLQDYCKNVIIDDSDSNIFGYYQESTKELRIYSKYLSKRYIPVLNENNVVDEKTINDFLNLNMLTNISHELGHIVRGKEFEEFKKRKTSFLDIKSDYALYYWFKNGTLRLFVGNDRYYQLHDEFIEEVRADIFSILDSNRVINEHFKDAFPQDLLERNCLWNAQRIVNFYTEKNENGISISTPMKKFDKMFTTMCPNEENKSLSRELEENASSSEVINNLLLGDTVPYYLLKHLFKIKSGQIITTNIYDELLNIIHQNKNETVDENKPKNK